MSMSPIRKKAQDKLRRKYGYSTNDNYGRGTVLYKADNEKYEHKDGYTAVNDINIVIDRNLFMQRNPFKPVNIEITRYRDDGGCTDKRYHEVATTDISISLEELDLIHAIAHEIAEEGNWKSQMKRVKQKQKQQEKNQQTDQQ